MQTILISLVLVLIWWSIIVTSQPNLEINPHIDQTIIDTLPTEQIQEQVGSWTTPIVSWGQISSSSSNTPRPKLHSLNKSSYTYGDLVEIRGEHLYAVENDKIVIIENDQWDKIRLDTIWNQRHSYISFVVPSQICTVLEWESGISDCAQRWGKMIDIPKWTYKLYYPDFEHINTYSNALDFIIK